MSGTSNQNASRHSGERVFIGRTPQNELPASSAAASIVIRGEPFVRKQKS